MSLLHRHVLVSAEGTSTGKTTKIINSPFFPVTFTPIFCDVVYFCQVHSPISQSFQRRLRQPHWLNQTSAGNYISVFLSPSSLYGNGSNLDLRLQGHELRGQMKGTEGRSKARESQGQNSIHLTLFSYSE